MDEKKKALLRQKWKEFWDSQPDEIIMPKAGPFGKDVILKKQEINGVPVYSASVDLALCSL